MYVCVTTATTWCSSGGKVVGDKTNKHMKYNHSMVVLPTLTASVSVALEDDSDVQSGKVSFSSSMRVGVTSSSPLCGKEYN